MDEKTMKRIGYAVIVVAIVIAGFLGVRYPLPDVPEEVQFGAQSARVADFVIPTQNATATPGVIINNKSAGADSLWISAASTPVVIFSRDGNLDVDGTTNLDDVDIDLATSLNIDGHMVDIGSGTYGTANGDNDLGVAGDVEVEGNVVMASGAYPLEFASAARRVFVGTTAAFTGTTVITSSTHGCTTAVSLALCQMQNPDDDSGDGFLCIAAVSGYTVTISAMDTAGDAATETDTVADYIIVGY